MKYRPTDLVPTETSLLWLDLPIAEIGRYPDAMRDMFRGQLSGMTIRQVFSAADAAHVRRRLESTESPQPMLESTH